MSQQELLKRVITALKNTSIQYMLTGSLVSSLQGEPRLTHDIDIVVAVPREAIKGLLAAFPPPDYYLDKRSILAAIEVNRAAFFRF